MLELKFKDAVAVPPYASLAMETMGQRIRTLRVARGWNQEQLALKAGVTLSAVSQWERDETKNPKLESFFAVAEALNTDPYYLVFGADRGAAWRSQREAQPSLKKEKP